MAFRIFLDQTVIRIIDETGKNEPIQYNPGQVKYYIKAGKFIFYDGIEQQDFNNHGYQDFADRFGTGFSSEDEFVRYLNGFINLSASGSLQNPGSVTDVDKAGRVSRNSIFGDKITANRVPQLAVQFQYPLASGDVRTPELGNGGTIVQENVLLKLRTAAQVGSFSRVQSTDTIRYIPGFECYFYGTPDFHEPVEGQRQIVGAMDEDTGFGYGYDGLDFVFMYRRDGVSQYFLIDLQQFEEKNGYTFIPQKGNIYLLTYGFLGYAPAKLEVIPPDGGLALTYTFKYPNAHDQTHLGQTFLPIRGELENLAGSTAMELTIGSIQAGIVDGGVGSIYTFARAFNYYRRDIPVSGNTELGAFRNKTTFGGITNYVKARLFNLNVAQSINRDSVVVIFKNPVILNAPTWVDVDADSVLEVSINVDIDFTLSTKTFFSVALFRTGNIDKNVEPFAFDLSPGDTAVFALVTTGSGEATFSNFWKELF